MDSAAYTKHSTGILTSSPSHTSPVRSIISPTTSAFNSMSPNLNLLHLSAPSTTLADNAKTSTLDMARPPASLLILCSCPITVYCPALSLKDVRDKGLLGSELSCGFLRQTA